MSGIVGKRMIIGADLGQMSDPTAFVAVDVAAITVWPDPTPKKQFRVRFLERPELGTPYKTITDRLVEIMSSPKLRPPGYGPPVLAVDQTGVGRPVVEWLRHSGLNPVGITISGGAVVTRTEPDRYPQDLTVPKKDLVAVIQMALGNELIKVAKLPLAPLLKKELQNFKIKYSKAGNQQFESWRETDHDDMVLALAVALWVAEHGWSYGVGMVPPRRQEPKKVDWK